MCSPEDILSAADYNHIPTFEAQIHRLSAHDLRCIGDVFMRHGAHEKFGAALLHRHIKLREGEVMVHHVLEDNSINHEICSPHRLQALNLTQLAPQSLFLPPRHGFRAFEFTMDHYQPTPSVEFLHELQVLLESRNLEQVICVAPLPDPVPAGHIIPETQLPGENGSLSECTRFAALGEDRGSAITTNWAFGRDAEGSVTVTEVKACVKNHAGVHDVKDQ